MQALSNDVITAASPSAEHLRRSMLFDYDTAMRHSKDTEGPLRAPSAPSDRGESANFHHKSLLERAVALATAQDQALYRKFGGQIIDNLPPTMHPTPTLAQQVGMRMFVQMLKMLKMLKCSNAQMLECANAQMLECTHAQTHKCTNAQMHNCKLRMHNVNNVG